MILKHGIFCSFLKTANIKLILHCQLDPLGGHLDRGVSCLPPKQIKLKGIVQCAIDVYSSMQSLLLFVLLSLSKGLGELGTYERVGANQIFYHLLTSSTRVCICLYGRLSTYAVASRMDWEASYSSTEKVWGGGRWSTPGMRHERREAAKLTRS